MKLQSQQKPCTDFDKMEHRARIYHNS